MQDRRLLQLKTPNQFPTLRTAGGFLTSDRILSVMLASNCNCRTSHTGPLERSIYVSRVSIQGTAHRGVLRTSSFDSIEEAAFVITVVRGALSVGFELSTHQFLPAALLAHLPASKVHSSTRLWFLTVRNSNRTALSAA